jgi:hypothetical protein
MAGRYLAAQVALEAASVRVLAELVADFIRLTAPTEQLHELRAALTAIAPDEDKHAELAWTIQRWLLDALSADERAEVTAVMTTTQNALWVDGPAARILLAALARRTGV